MDKGIITTIQRMSIHDGPGIRSTVFLKGCNLRCQWCHNPETFQMRPELEFQQDLCIHCGSCTEVCQPKALQMVDGRLQLNRSACELCFDCIDVCYPGALRKMGLEHTPASLTKALLEDAVFFRQSDGGVTFSGGEPMLQVEFVRETAKMLKAEGIHVAIETNMKVSWEKYLEILPLLDLVMADIKLVDDPAHRHWTGAGNETILRNIRNLDQSGVPYILRTPVVPGVNDSLQQMEQIFSFVSGLKNYEKYELLPYHPMADFKYENLGYDNSFDGVPGLKKGSLEIYTPLFEQYKINQHGRA